MWRSFGFEVVFGVLAFVGLWVTVDRTAAGILRAWEWLRRDRVGPLVEEEGDPDEQDLCSPCLADAHCDGSVSWCNCTCTWPEDWAGDLPPERSAEALGFTGKNLGLVATMRSPTFLERLEARRERLASAAELEHRAAYEAMGFEFPSGLMARVREAGL